jgi:hypothetical protein
MVCDRRDQYAFSCLLHGEDMVRFVVRFNHIPPQNISEKDLKKLNQSIAFKDIVSQTGPGD